ncbi:MAG: hypothetical protein AAB553_02040 [Patescibacteria group bacterium]
MDSNVLQKIKEALSTSTSIGIAVGPHPSLDDMAAALSFYLLLKNANKQVSIASATSPIVEVSGLVGINHVQEKLGGGEAGDLVVSFPYRDGEIEKVSYTLDEQKGLLNIIVKAGELGLSFEEKDVQYVKGSGSIDLLIVVGTPSLADLSSVIDAQKLQDIKIVNIDVKQHNQRFGDVVMVATNRSSVSEHMADILLSLGFQFDQDSAQNLFNGISSATKGFQDPSTSALAFEIVSILMKRGAKRIATPVSTMQPSANPFGTLPQQPPVPMQVPQPTQPMPQPPLTSSDVPSPEDRPPVDWLSPKVYKGSSNFEG